MKNHNILIQDIVLFSEFLMKAKKAKAEKSKSKKTGKKSTKKRTKKSGDLPDDPGIVLIDDDLKIDDGKGIGRTESIFGRGTFSRDF